ncbi:tetratricopeptide repeat protein [Estrella lausannensis]|uniref:Uncharacterized protein n=1 Tax=Estrella lausannensis TaxID=483423 RepID=A0A0H5DNX4_9BACT|nr:tetratricopeptide repeat protein [Estrella lausannensis]CRX38121.1 hypothetical protein ELAC_0769 [Estrella lausannensis]
MKKIAFFSFILAVTAGCGFAAETSATSSQIKTLIIENKLDEARSLADREIQNNPEDVDTIRRRGFVYFMQGDYQSAAEDFTAYLSARPGSAKGYLYRGLAYIAMGDEARGKEDVKTALSIKPNLASTVDELMPKMLSGKKEKKSKEVALTTKKGVPVKTKKGAVAYKLKG